MVHVVMFSNGSHDDDIAVTKWEPLITTDVQENAANVYARALASKKHSRLLWVETSEGLNIKILGLWDVHGTGIEVSALMLSGIMVRCYTTLAELVRVHNGCKGMQNHASPK